MRTIYILAWLFALPFVWPYLLWRSRRQPEYRRHWAERLGWAPISSDRPLIWLHAVSVGETRAAAPIVAALLARYPGHQLLLTQATPTGRATAHALFGERVRLAYLPYDLPPCVGLFLRRVRPVFGLIMETELWPNLLHACQRRQIPVLLVNARLSARSARGYRRVAPLTAQALRDLSAIAAQTSADARRLRVLGARRVRVTGNLKFDVPPPPDTALRAAGLRRLFAHRLVFLAASTRDGEEAMLLDALAGVQLPGLLLVIVPRHPQRFETVAELLHARGVRFARRSRDDAVDTRTAVYLGDSMGELAAYYAAAELCYIGGSLLPLGGQNLIEAAAAGCPALVGPHTWNFQAVTAEAVRCGAARRVADAAALGQALTELAAAPARRAIMAEAGRAFAHAHQGATGRVMQLLDEVLSAAATTRPGP